MTYIGTEKYRILSPAEGKYLHNGDVYTPYDVYLGTTDSPSNWEEVDEIPEEEVTENEYTEN